jgi:lipooligosaccharide transport system permease protein
MTAAARPRTVAGPPRLGPILHFVEHRLLLYRRAWRGSAISSFLTPILFLASMGLGLGGIVDGGAGGAGGALGVPYLVFLAPGLLAGTAMQTAAGECTFPVMSGFLWSKNFLAAHASPLRPIEIAIGYFAWVAFRLLLVCGIYTAIIVAFGAAASPLVVLAIPAAVLTGLAFATPITAYAATQRETQGFNALFRFGITPLFIFSGTFFPIEGLPAVLQPIAWLTPLFHGVSLSRSLALGTALDEPVATIAHVGYLVALALIGAWWAARTFERRLER